MTEQAKITSLEALEAFRSNLIVYLTKSSNALAQVTDEIRRMKMWLENDQKMHWEMEIRRRKRVLDQAEGELLTAKRSSLRNDVSAQILAVRRAKAAVEEGELKLRNVKRWAQNYESALDPVAKKLQRMRNFLGHDLPKATLYLAQTQNTLQGYLDMGSAPDLVAPPAEGAEFPETSTEAPPSLSSRVGGETIVQAAKELILHWEDTRMHWRDAKSREFEEKFLSDLPHHVASTAQVITEIDAILRKIRTDCE